MVATSDTETLPILSDLPRELRRGQAMLSLSLSSSRTVVPIVPRTSPVAPPRSDSHPSPVRSLSPSLGPSPVLSLCGRPTFRLTIGSLNRSIALDTPV